MQVIEAEYEIVTPMFIGGANKDDDIPEIRPPSVKGALRFWWRALQWGKYLAKADNDAKKALQALHKQEGELFGAAVSETSGGQGKALLKIKQAPLIASKIKVSPAQGYLLGQGLYHFNKGVARKSLNSRQKFKVILKLSNDVDTPPLIDTLLIFGLLGGLGSRSRRGWGSVAIRSLVLISKDKSEQNFTLPTDKDSYNKAITRILVSRPDGIPPFTAFTKQTRIDISTSAFEPAEGLLTSIGNEMQMYRSYGKKEGNKHMVNGELAEKKFRGDHDNVCNFIIGKPVSAHPKRIIFGLPHNYYFSSIEKKNGNKIKNSKVDVNAKNFSRRASPLMIHIHRFLSGECIAVQSLFKAYFLPKSEKIQLKQKKKTPKEFQCDIDWNTIIDYLNRKNFEQGKII